MGSPSKGRQRTGDALLTKKEAAEHLGVSSRVIRRLISEGVLELVKVQGKQYFYLTDVNAAAHVISRGINVVTANQNALRALAATQRLERRMNDLAFIFGARFDFVPLTEGRVLEAWHKAHAALHLRFDDLTATEVMEWARFFYEVDTGFLFLAAHVLDNQEPWAPFIELANHIRSGAPRSPQPEVRAAYNYFAAATRFMENCAYICCRQLQGERAANRTFPSMEGDIVSSLLSIIQLADSKESGPAVH